MKRTQFQAGASPALAGVVPAGYLLSLGAAEELAVFVESRGHCLLDNGRTREARMAYEHACRLDPLSPGHWSWLDDARVRETSLVPHGGNLNTFSNWGCSMTISCLPIGNSTLSAEPVRTFPLDSTRYRNYHPTLGRWIERDPVPYPDGMNAYQYISSNPVKLTDPMGLSGEAPPVNLTGVNIIRVTKKTDMPSSDVMGKTTFKVSSMEFTVELRGDKCCVVVASAEWKIESKRYADEGTFLSQAPAAATGWTWSDYEKAKALNMSDRDWHDKTQFVSWASVEAHEDAHVAQLKDVGGKALEDYIKNYNKKPEYCFDNPHSAMDRANEMSSSDWYWLQAEAAIGTAWLQKYGTYGGQGEGGEEGAVQAERQALETQYQDYLRKKEAELPH